MEGNALASSLCVPRTMEYCTFQFHNTIVSLPPRSACIYIYGYLSVRDFTYTYIFTWLFLLGHNTRISWIHIHALFLYEYYIFIFVLRYSIVSQAFCTTYSLDFFLLVLLGIKRILYYLATSSVSCITYASMYHISGYTTYVWRRSNSKEAIQRKYP